jgi:hypothetical protein
MVYNKHSLKSRNKNISATKGNKNNRVYIPVAKKNLEKRISFLCQDEFGRNKIVLKGAR